MMCKLQLLTLLSMVAPLASAQEFRETAVPNAQIPAVVRDVAQWHDMQYPDCHFIKAVGSKLADGTAEYSVEHWTISACSGREFTYEVTVLDSQGGGVTNMVSNLDGEPVANAEPPAELDAKKCADMQSKFDELGADKTGDTDYSLMAQLAADLAVCKAFPISQ